MKILKTEFYKSALVATAMIMAIGTASASESKDWQIATGAKLYDNWMSVLDMDPPAKPHSLYPADKAYANDAKSSWRCKECHGWDYMGKDGAYRSGKHFSGIKGINGAQGKSARSIIDVLTDKKHGYGDKLSKTDLGYLALFVSEGQEDMSTLINSDKSIKQGNMLQGKAYYETICAGCHGLDGMEPSDMDPLGELMGNPWETAHKVLNGQPDEAMPGLRSLDRQVLKDLLAYLATLPKE